MNSITLFEFDKLVEATPGAQSPAVPKRVFDWLQAQCLRRDEGAPAWLRQKTLDGKPAVQITSYVGVLRAPCGFQIEVLPKTGRSSSTPDEARALLIEMLQCLRGFKHFETQQTEVKAVRMPLLEVFVQQFLQAVNALVKRGLRSDYVARQDNLFALRGRLLVARQITHNLVRRDRFHTEHDEFSQNRAENRLIHTALCQVLSLCRAQDNQRLARELGFVFAEVPLSTNVALDLQRIRLDRGMGYYEPALNWARLILQGFSPITGLGAHEAPSLLFAMQDLFEAYVAKHLARQLRNGYTLKAQARSEF